MLPLISEKVRGKCDIYIDGGVQKGSDVFKAIALGANMVFLGRAALWGLACGGQNGVKKVIDIIKEELDLTMVNAGVNSICKIKESYTMLTNSPNLRCNL